MSIEEAVGHRFARPELLKLALTHRSVSADDPSRNDNERLEFLGDAVLQLVVTRLLYEKYPQLAEGQMAKVRAAVVSKPALAAIARALEIGTHVELAPAEERTGGRKKDSILADTLEAIIGAVYLDADIDAVSHVVVALWTERVAEKARQPGVKDYKTRLQEVLARNGKRPLYKAAGSGPDHDRSFTAEVSVDGQVLGQGTGKSKKQAEQAAAGRALEDINQDRR